MPDMKNILTTKRSEVAKWLERCLIGPFSGLDNEVLHMRPSQFYACGYLSGQWPEDEYEDDTEPEEDDSPMFAPQKDDDPDSEQTDTAKKTCRYKPPSAMGLSFFVSKDAVLEVNLQGARYLKSTSKNSRKEIWTRRPLPLGGKDEVESIPIAPPENDAVSECSYPVLEDNLCKGEEITFKDGHSAILHTRWRDYSDGDTDGYILTISLVNTAICTTPDYKDWEQTHLFQVVFNCVREQGEIFPYPKTELASIGNDLEERQLELIYRDKQIYAIGHNTSPDWEFEESSEISIKAIRAVFLPTCEVPLMKFSIDDLDQDIFRFEALAKTSETPQLSHNKLEEFLGSYEEWANGLKKTKTQFSKNEQKTADTLIADIEANRKRIQSGIDLLATNKNAETAFALTHQAMVSYMYAWGKQSGRNNQNPSWRPFQLAFLLLTMPSLVEKDCVERDIVDLLWFQTGGGKTEAYLAIIAFLICYRRLEYDDNGYGTTVIMRYTLRLLTMQQFQRASILVCALELIRQAHPDLLGDEPITTGLWLGGASSPNTYQQAIEYVQSKKPEKLVVTECPWCGATFEDGNYICGQSIFRFVCKNNQCDFFGQKLPLNVVDDELYSHPPTLLFATVDKFAMFAWNERAGCFLGTARHKPPDLIIQDELHLISSELGSITGIYEAAFDTILRVKNCRPKYIASTATIRNAKEQVRKLYARDTNIFPPPGINWSDSFFARVDTEKPGRLYIGYNSPFISRNHSFAPLAASLITAPPVWKGKHKDEAIIDAWWTLVAYHGSLRGLGITQILFSDEVQHYIQSIIAHICDKEFLETTDKDFPITVDTLHDYFPNINSPEDAVEQFVEHRGLNAEQGIVQLTSNRTPSEIRTYLEALSHPYSDENNNAITAVLSTNMVSVGLDISRLGLMVINGQPFTTGEYIQASSRVGRGDVPGIVVAHYFRNNSRDLSHFENFRAYHESFYRFVEPTSLTPFSVPAIKRALHAALVIVVRHACNLTENDMANEFDPAARTIAPAINMLRQRCIEASPEREKEITYHIECLTEEWSQNTGDRYNRLTYKRRNKSHCLLVGFEEEGAPEHIPWKTMHSVRQVDDECGIRLVAPR